MTDKKKESKVTKSGAVELDEKDLDDVQGGMKKFNEGKHGDIYQSGSIQKSTDKLS